MAWLRWVHPKWPSEVDEEVRAPPAATQKDADPAADLYLRDSLVQMITSWQRTLSYKLGRQIYPSVRAPLSQAAPDFCCSWLAG